jgi:small basic protein
MVLAVAAAGASVAAADGGLPAGFQSSVKASVFIASFSFAMHVAARITRAAPRARRPAIPSGLRTGW